MLLFFRIALLWYYLTSAKGNFVKCIPKCTDEVITAWQKLGDKDTAVKNEPCQQKTDLWPQNVDNAVNVVLSVCLPLSGVSTTPRELLYVYGHLRTLPTLLHCWTVPEQRLFLSLGTMAFAQCYWISSGFVAGTLGFRHLPLFCAFVPVSNCVSHLHLENGRKAEFRLERDVMRRKMLKTVSFGVSCQGFNR